MPPPAARRRSPRALHMPLPQPPAAPRRARADGSVHALAGPGRAGRAQAGPQLLSGPESRAGWGAKTRAQGMCPRGGGGCGGTGKGGQPSPHTHPLPSLCPVPAPFFPSCALSLMKPGRRGGVFWGGRGCKGRRIHGSVCTGRGQDGTGGPTPPLVPRPRPSAHPSAPGRFQVLAVPRPLAPIRVPSGGQAPRPCRRPGLDPRPRPPSSEGLDAQAAGGPAGMRAAAGGAGRRLEWACSRHHRATGVRACLP